MKARELVESLERAADRVGEYGVQGAVCHASGGVMDAARLGDKLAARAFAALAKMAGHPEWVGDDGLPSVREELAR